MPEDCDFTVIFWVYNQFGGIRETESGAIVWKTYIFMNSNFLSYKNWKQN